MNARPFRLAGLIRNTQQADSFVETIEPVAPQTPKAAPSDSAPEQLAPTAADNPPDAQTPEPEPARRAQTPMFEPSMPAHETAVVTPLFTRPTQRPHAPFVAPETRPETREVAHVEETAPGAPQTQAAPAEALKQPAPQIVAQKPEPVAAQVAQPVVAEAASLKPREPRTLRVSLRPDELGRVEVELSRDVEGRLTARLTAETESAHRLLSGGLEQLRQTLENSGLQVERLDVSVGAGAQQQQTGQQGGGARGGDSFPAGHYFGPEDTQVIATRGGAQDDAERLVSLRA